MTAILSGTGVLIAAVILFVAICLGGWVRDVWRVLSGTVRP